MTDTPIPYTMVFLSGVLAGAEDDGVGLDQARLAVEHYVQAGIIDTLVGSASDGFDIGALQPLALDPVGGDGERAPQFAGRALEHGDLARGLRSEEHTSDFQSLMRISYAVFCLK